MSCYFKWLYWRTALFSLIAHKMTTTEIALIRLKHLGVIQSPVLYLSQSLGLRTFCYVHTQLAVPALPGRCGRFINFF